MIRLTTAEKIERADFLRFKSNMYAKRMGWLDEQKTETKIIILLLVCLDVQILNLCLPLILEKMFGFSVSWTWIFWMLAICLMTAAICYVIYQWLLARNRYAWVTRWFQLAGVTLYHFSDNLIFTRLAHYTGARGYWGTAILNMFVLKNERRTRLVVANFRCEESPHAFVEFKSGGLWWVLDPTDDRNALQMRLIHDLRYSVKRRRVVSAESFWKSHIIKKYYASFVGDPKIYDQMDGIKFFYRLEAFGKEAFRVNPASGEPMINTAMTELTWSKRPVSWDILREYLEKPTRLFPKRRTYLEAVRAEKNNYEKGSP